MLLLSPNCPISMVSSPSASTIAVIKLPRSRAPARATGGLAWLAVTSHDTFAYDCDSRGSATAGAI